MTSKGRDVDEWPRVFPLALTRPCSTPHVEIESFCLKDRDGSRSEAKMTKPGLIWRWRSGDIHREGGIPWMIGEV